MGDQTNTCPVNLILMLTDQLHIQISMNSKLNFIPFLEEGSS
jgi:hypothetical protein